MINARLPSAYQFEQDVRQALKDWHNELDVTSPLASLYLYRKIQRAGHTSARQATNQMLLQGLELLKEKHEMYAQILQERYLNLMPTVQLASKLNIAESTVYTIQRDAIRRLADILRLQEQSVGAQQKAILTGRLPAASYVNLIGINSQIEELTQLLALSQPPWVMTIEGIGGIGKTSLAHALAWQVIQRSVFDEVAWISIPSVRFGLNGSIKPMESPLLQSELLIKNLFHQLLPELVLTVQGSPELMLMQLQKYLKEIPHLIVIDNLETLADGESFLPILQKLANPTKFVLTSRARIYAELNLYHVQVSELSEQDALRLVRQEAELSNLPVLATSPDAELRTIVETVGGNPLALRLIVGQTHIHPLETILGELRTAHGTTVENLYSFIYRSAWESLDELGRRVLLIMPLVNAQGEDLDYLVEVGEIAAGDVRMALNKLVTLNLIDVRGGLHERRYSIHSLTRTFLLEQVVQWG